jgi:hypothetical protein
MNHYPENTTPAGDRLLSIPLSTYRNQFKQILIPQLLLVLVSYLLVQVSPYDFSLFAIQRLSTPIMAVLVILSFMHSSYQRRRLAKLYSVESFEDRARQHQRIYQFRLFWFLFSAFTSCCLFVLAQHRLFFYFALFDTLLLVMNYPNKQVFRRELQEEEIIFY